MNDPTSLKDNNFRDKLYTVSNEGERLWVYPKKISGSYYSYRTYVSGLLLAFMIFMPFIKVDGHPIFLFNILERRFILFGQIFWPQDFHLFVIGMLAFIVFIILFTAIFGRVFCGWACPQTVFMEMVFRKIEYWIEGDAGQQKKLDAAPWNAVKIRKKVSKWILFYGIAFIVSHTLYSWIIGVDQVFEQMSTSPGKHPGGFALMIGSSFLIFGIFARFREQMCTTFCPYGRLQGVLLGNDSLVVAYDYKRGEPRGKGRRREGSALGDCVDCDLCVKVCPTGIDIRNGTQLECVNCTACIDACDSIMDKFSLPKGLVGYKSDTSIQTGTKFTLSTRQKAYIVLLFLILGFLSGLLFVRSDIEATILRNPGTLSIQNDDGTISNLYKLQIVNKTFEEIPFSLEAEHPDMRIRLVGENPGTIIPESGSIHEMFFLDIPKEDVHGIKMTLKIHILDADGNRIETVKTNFLGATNTSAL